MKKEKAAAVATTTRMSRCRLPTAVAKRLRYITETPLLAVSSSIRIAVTMLPYALTDI